MDSLHPAPKQNQKIFSELGEELIDNNFQEIRIRSISNRNNDETERVDQHY